MIKKKSNTPTLLYLTESSLSVQTEKKVLSTVSFPKELVKDKTILDVDALKSFISSKLEKIDDVKNIKVIVIGKGILFQAAVLLESPGDKEKEFFASIPYDESDIAEKRIRTKTKEYILVTSRKFYQSILSVLESQSSSVVAVVPLSLFVDEVDEDVLKSADVKAIFSKEQLYAQANFLDTVSVPQAKSEDVVQSDGQKSIGKESASMPPFTLVKKWNMTALLVILGFLVISTIIFGGFLFIEQKRFAGAPTPTPTMSAEITPEPTVAIKEEEEKGSLTVRILNGTGTAGQAGRAKLIMEELGYNSVDTGNAESTDNIKTTVSFSDKVSKLRSEEIVKELEKTFESVTVAKDESLTSDILVVTGEEK